MRSQSAWNCSLCRMACRVLTCLRSSAFLISSLPASLRRISFTCGRCEANASGSVKVFALSDCLRLSCTLPRVDQACLLQVGPDHFRLLHAQSFRSTVLVGHGNGGELVLLDDPEVNPRVGLNFPLKLPWLFSAVSVQVPFLSREK